MGAGPGTPKADPVPAALTSGDGATQLKQDLMTHRKAEHVQIVLDQNVEGRYRYWNDIELLHDALPEIDMDEIDTTVRFLGQKLNAPLVITGMTGGYPGATFINRNLARATAELGLAFGVGSERAAIVKGSYPESYSCAREFDVPLKLANLGAPQLIPQRPGERPVTVEDAERAMELIGAHALAVHLNFLQERVQPEGDERAKGCLAQIGKLARRVPVVVKETGAGLSPTVAQRLRKVGVAAFDVSGRGGTSFAAVEHFRAKRQGALLKARLGETFWDWGIPSPVCVVQLASLHVPVIASGGVRSGLDAARALALGANAVGTAGGILKAATSSYEETVVELTAVIEELRTAMFLTGSRTIKDLQKVRTLIRGETREWLGN